MINSKIKYFLFPLIILIFVFISFILVSFPQHAIVAGGDFYQLPNFGKQLSRYQFAWFNQIGQGVFNPLVVSYPYYFFLSILEKVLPSGFISSAIIFFFLTSSFFSFYISTGLLFNNYFILKKILISLIYSLNSFVVMIFSYTWGYTHHYLLYPIFPLILSLFIRLLFSKEIKFKIFLAFILSNVLALPSYNNVSFIVLVLLSYCIVLFFSISFGILKPSVKLLKRIIIIFGSFLLLTLPLFIPIVERTIQNNGAGFKNHAAMGGENYLEGWIRSTSNSPQNIFNLALDNYRYPYVDLPNIISLIGILINSFYFFLLVFLIVKNKQNFRTNQNENKILLVTTYSFLTLFLLSCRYFEPFEVINKLLYQSSFFIFFRSSEKIFLLLILFYTMTIASLLEKVKIKKWKLLFSGLLIVLLFPFSVGVINSSLENSYNRFAKKKTPDYKDVVKIPDEYYQLANIINKDDRQTAVLSLPYSVKNSINWSNYPAWNFVGHDVLHLIFDKRYISANTHDNPSLENILIFKKLIDENSDESEVMSAIEKFGTEYIIYHKDIDTYLFNKSKKFYEKMLSLENTGNLEKIAENDYFVAFHISEEKIKPLLSLKNSVLKYKKINPTLYIIEIESGANGELKFLQSYDSGWKLGLISKRSPLCEEKMYYYPTFMSIECLTNINYFFSFAPVEIYFNPILTFEHSMCDNFANCWDVEPNEFDKYYLVLYYKHQNIVYLYSLILIIFIFSVSTILIKCIKK